MNNFGGHVITFKNAAEDADAAFDEDILVEVVDFQKDGRVEVGFNIGTLRVYLQVRIQDLLSGVARSHGSDTAQ